MPLDKERSKQCNRFLKIVVYFALVIYCKSKMITSTMCELSLFYVTCNLVY